MGIGLPIILLVVFGLIGIAVPGNVAGTGLTIIDLYVPTLMVISFIFLGIYSLPITLVRYREMGWLRRVSTTPESPSRLLAAQLIINLVLALAAILILIFGSELIFGASLHVRYSLFCSLNRSLDCGDILSWLGCCGRGSITAVESAVSGVLMFLSFFLSGLWVQPAQVGGPVATIMYYSPSGAAVSALLYSVFNTAPPYTSHSDDGRLHGHLRIRCDPLLPLGMTRSISVICRKYLLPMLRIWIGIGLIGGLPPLRAPAFSWTSSPRRYSPLNHPGSGPHVPPRPRRPHTTLAPPPRFVRST